MEESGLIDRLIEFGLTRQEAILYLALMRKGELTGYEAAKETGISRSNVYSALAGLTDKGAAYIMEGAATRYVPVQVEEFCDNAMEKLKHDAEYLQSHMPQKRIQTEGYITIDGAAHIQDKIRHMIQNCEKRIYLAADRKQISVMEEQIREAITRKIKTVIITDEGCDIEGAITYHTKMVPGQLRLITDSAFVLTGEWSETEGDTCLYSGQENLITVFKENLSNMIALIKIENKN